MLLKNPCGHVEYGGLTRSRPPEFRTYQNTRHVLQGVDHREGAEGVSTSRRGKYRTEAVENGVKPPYSRLRGNSGNPQVSQK